MGNKHDNGKWSFLGEGGYKKAYSIGDLCVKIIKNPKILSKRLRHYIELEYLEQIFAKGHSYDFIAQYHGELIGAVFETVRNDDGKVSRSLDEILNDEKFLYENYDKILKALVEFYNKLYNNSIMSRNSNPENLLLKESKDGWRFVLIDDIGTTTFIHLEYYFKFLARMKTKKYFLRFINRIAKLYNSALPVKLAKDVKNILNLC
ncbi:MAG: hypothetical protein LBO62_01130 [Endomicrobium sp.]|jgi:hypothetical protein|nr:hypothetical protein [Endomicrobium sp.]